MKAMILAAGFGTRLRPLTCTMPKPVIPVCNKPMIQYAVDHLLGFGISEIIVNVHYLPAMIENFLRDHYAGVTFHFSREDEILGTGGGVARVRKLLEGEEEFLLVNGDTIQFPRFDALLRARREHDALAALALRHAPPDDRFTAVWFEDGSITGFGSGRGEPLMFAGTHAISTRIFDRMPQQEVFSIVEDVYQPVIGKERIAAVVDDDPRWFDVGTPGRYLAATRALCGDSAVGARSRVDGIISASAVWDDCRIGADVRIDGSIIASGVELHGPRTIRNTIVCRDDAAIGEHPGWVRENGLVFAPF